MSLHLTQIVCVVASLLAIPTGETHAQLFNPAAACYCIRPVTQAYYQSIPVTEYRQVTTTVRRPVIETSYVNQQVTDQFTVDVNRSFRKPRWPGEPVLQ